MKMELYGGQSRAGAILFWLEKLACLDRVKRDRLFNSRAAARGAFKCECVERLHVPNATYLDCGAVVTRPATQAQHSRVHGHGVQIVAWFDGLHHALPARSYLSVTPRQHC